MAVVATIISSNDGKSHITTSRALTFYFVFNGRNFFTHYFVFLFSSLPPFVLPPSLPFFFFFIFLLPSLSVQKIKRNCSRRNLMFDRKQQPVFHIEQRTFKCQRTFQKCNYVKWFTSKNLKYIFQLIHWFIGCTFLKFHKKIKFYF